MSPEEAVRARLLSLAPVTDLVSTRVWMLKLPQSATLPAIRVQQVSEVTRYTHEGRERLLQARVQVDAYADEAAGGDPYASAIAAADAVQGDGARTAATGLDGFQGDIGSPAFQVAGIMRFSRTVGYDAEELRLVRVRQDFMVRFYE